FAGSALQQFGFMRSAVSLVLLQSTFSWWPAFLGDASKVIAPIPSTGAWADGWSEGGNEDYANLIERDRFQCILCSHVYEPTSRERFHQNWRFLKRLTVLKANRTLRLAMPVPSP